MREMTTSFEIFVIDYRSRNIGGFEKFKKINVPGSAF